MGPQVAPLLSPCRVFQKLFNQGMILAYAYEDAAGSKVPTDEVEEKNGTAAKGECRGRASTDMTEPKRMALAPVLPQGRRRGTPPDRGQDE